MSVRKLQRSPDKLVPNIPWLNYIFIYKLRTHTHSTHDCIQKPLCRTDVHIFSRFNDVAILATIILLFGGHGGDLTTRPQQSQIAVVIHRERIIILLSYRLSSTYIIRPWSIVYTIHTSSYKTL